MRLLLVWGLCPFLQFVAADLQQLEDEADIRGIQQKPGTSLSLFHVCVCACVYFLAR